MTDVTTYTFVECDNGYLKAEAIVGLAVQGTWDNTAQAYGAPYRLASPINGLPYENPTLITTEFDTVADAKAAALTILQGALQYVTVYTPTT